MAFAMAKLLGGEVYHYHTKVRDRYSACTSWCTCPPPPQQHTCLEALQEEVGAKPGH